jgi:hypothetical protein
MTTMQTTRTSLRRRTLLAMAVSAIGLAGAARADVPPDLVDLQVVDRDTGQPLRTWRHDGRLFVAGQPGARYALRVTNHSGGRVLVVMSVDGVNIITGQTAGYGQTGYVFSPYQSFDIAGWRKSESEIAAFNFAPLPQSYAARTGRPGDVGVIGVAAFRERVVPPPPAPAAEPIAEAKPGRRSGADNSLSEIVVTGSLIPSPNAAPAPAARAAPAPADAVVAAQRRDEKLGTAHGAREWSVSTTVAFERATPYPQLIRRIEYDTYDNLVAGGVIPSPSDPGRRPRPFPSNGYVPDPPGGR